MDRFIRLKWASSSSMITSVNGSTVKSPPTFLPEYETGLFF
jgi:hypothetical protein